MGMNGAYLLCQRRISVNITNVNQQSTEIVVCINFAIKCIVSSAQKFNPLALRSAERIKGVYLKIFIHGPRPKVDNEVKRKAEHHLTTTQT